MDTNPILIIQMQRLGDVVLTFPLLGWLERLFPDTPRWILGEEPFYKGLLPLSPRADYISSEAGPAIQKRNYIAVINLSHRPESLRLAGLLQTQTRLGLYETPEGGRHIGGDWQLYRASLTRNNRHNRYHWADLNALDIIPRKILASTRWPAPRPFSPARSGHIGLFVGASQPEKRPDASFWIDLTRRLLTAGHRPVLLGGKAEVALGREVAGALKAPSLNLCGRFSIKELAEFVARLDLFVTPDTGPMHVAAWTGTPTLNLSIGPVNAWETGPFSQGHLVLRPRLSCAGCWECVHESVRCKNRLSAREIMPLVQTALMKGREAAARLELPGWEVCLTARDGYGLYSLIQAGNGKQPPSAHTALSRFWQAFFGNALGYLPPEALDAARKTLETEFPSLIPPLAQSAAALTRHIAAALKSRARNDRGMFRDFSLGFIPALRPLSSYASMLLMNGDFSRAAFARALDLAERLVF